MRIIPAIDIIEENNFTNFRILFTLVGIPPSGVRGLI